MPIMLEEMMKKMLEKIDAEEADNESNMEEFERKLADIMRRYRIDNSALASEIASLHRDIRS